MAAALMAAVNKLALKESRWEEHLSLPAWASANFKMYISKGVRNRVDLHWMGNIYVGIVQIVIVTVLNLFLFQKETLVS